MKNARYSFLLLLLIVFVFACKKDEEPETTSPTPTESSGVSFDLGLVPYPNLSQYRFFVGEMSDLHPNERVLPYDVITPLFTDYAKKKKFIWMPEGTSASYASDNNVLDFPDGAVMVKSFYYNNVQPYNTKKILETRLIYKKDGQWHFADYIWNEDQTEATFSLAGHNVPLEWIDDNGTTRNITYRIPSEQECFTCHKEFNISSPIGPKPQNMNKDYPYEDGAMNQLEKWISVGYLTNNIPADINTVVDWTDETQSLESRWRAYVDMNCSHCHREGSHCDYRPLRLAWSETSDVTNLGVCVVPDEEVNSSLTHIIARGNVARSVMNYRVGTVEEQYRMPLLGRTIVHEEALELLQQYINSLSPECP